MSLVDAVPCTTNSNVFIVTRHDNRWAGISIHRAVTSGVHKIKSKCMNIFFIKFTLDSSPQLHATK